MSAQPESHFEPPASAQVVWLPTRDDAQLLLESSGECTFITDRDGRILALNPMAQQLVGRTRDVVGQGFHELMGCRTTGPGEASACPHQQMIQTGEVAMLVSQHWRRGDGNAFELSISFWPRLQAGERVGGVVVCRDQTAAIEAQRDVQRVARLAEDAPNPIVEFDAAGAMLYANNAMVELMAQCGALQQGFEAVFPPNLPDILQECLRTRTPGCRVEHPVANVVMAWSFFPVGDLQLVRAYGNDITADVALRRAKEAAEESARAKGIFLATMSHELRTPMNGVLGCTQLLQDTSLTETQRQLIQSMHRSADALLVLVNDILDFSKIEAGKMTLETADVQFHALIDDVVTLVSELARKKGLALTIQVASEVPNILRGDPVRLRQILFNLVGNGIKFTESGRVDVRVERRPSPAHLPETVLLEWSVADTGIGMTEEQQSRLFQAYSQAEASTARRFGGTGLGLMICRQLVELMGGEIIVRSALGKGTTFTYTTLLMPASEQSPLPGREAEGAPAGTTAPDHRRVLVADDNEVNQLVASKFLQKLGYQVEVVQNGREAVEALARATYDAVLMDCDMPDMDGYQATRAIRTREAEGQTRIPIIALTGHATDEDERICKQAGMDAVVTKPVTLPVLRATLDRALRRT
jgi:PAS domain S-box-containing protein